mmetsp:Transcript_9263/g.16338  ORF Transcript_9263/g.16338 Transcript_9263/m.16338 type:complete len:96 (+) Transcript_9263:343-630(+)
MFDLKSCVVFTLITYFLPSKGGLFMARYAPDLWSMITTHAERPPGSVGLQHENEYERIPIKYERCALGPLTHIPLHFKIASLPPSINSVCAMAAD